MPKIKEEGSTERNCPECGKKGEIKHFTYKGKYKKMCKDCMKKLYEGSIVNLVNSDMSIIDKPPEPNFSLITGEKDNALQINFTVKKNLKNKIKWWLFCKVFPFRIGWWK